MKLATKKKKQKMNSKRQSEVTRTTPTFIPILGIDEESNENCSDSGNSNATIRRINTNKRNANWMEMYQRLVAYKKEHKDTNVPQHFIEDPKLGVWVNNQRTAYRKKNMTDERKRLLNYIGFGTNTAFHIASWEESYQRLVAYEKEHKDTRVPFKYEKDLKLGIWVNSQRKANKNKKLTEERKRLLQLIGFVWNAKSQLGNSRCMEEMKEYTSRVQKGP